MLNGVSGKAELTIRFQSQKPGELAEAGAVAVVSDAAALEQWLLTH